MTAIAHAVILSGGFRRLAIAFLAGAFAALAMPPVNLIVALAVSVPVAVWLIDGAAEGQGRASRASLKAAALAGWAFGFGYFLAGLWWLGAAFLVETDEFLWLMPFGVVGLPLVLGLFHALGFVVARLLWSRGAWRIFAFAFGMGLAEWLRSTVLTGFPWNLFGEAFGALDVFAQSASLIGVPGLTLVALLVFASPALIATGASGRERWLFPSFALVLLAGMAVFGAWRLSGAETAFVPGVKLRIVQANVSERDRIKPGGAAETLRRYLALSDRATTPGTSGIADATHVIWPESALPFILSREPEALARISALFPRGTSLITGAVRVELPPAGQRDYRYFNALQVVNEGAIVETYDKVHLVPFGEYLPGGGLLERLGLRKFVQEPGNFVAGTRHRLLDLRGLPPVLPLICYEAVFPFEITDGVGRPGVMINVTNDAWFGLTFGPYQHFAQARMRAVEQGVPLVRAANTGISGVVDAYGRILRASRLGTEDVIDAGLPRAIAPTLFSRFGAMILAGLMVAFLLVALTARLRP